MVNGKVGVRDILNRIAVRRKGVYWIIQKGYFPPYAPSRRISLKEAFCCKLSAVSPLRFSASSF